MKINVTESRTISVNVKPKDIIRNLKNEFKLSLGFSSDYYINKSGVWCVEFTINNIEEREIRPATPREIETLQALRLLEHVFAGISDKNKKQY